MIYNLKVLLGIALLAASFWCYSRFTVDDAFITWRYGKNLIQNGIWNFNPSTMDTTQAYTNPIFAAMSILPAYFDMDVVLFFKFFGLLSMFLFTSWYLRATKGSWMSLIPLLSLPATIIHIFSGLETFIFVILLSALFVAVDKQKSRPIILLSLTLFFIRPESWLLAILIPLFSAFSLTKDSSTKSENAKVSRVLDGEISFNANQFIKMSLSLILPLGCYLFLNNQYFGYPLPNTFYIKVQSSFSLYQFIVFSVFLAPAITLIILGKRRMFAFVLIFYLPIIVNYSLSDLMMNYSGRFAFHIFFPIYVCIIYAVGSKSGYLRIETNEELIARLKLKTFTKCVAVFMLLAFFITSGRFNNYMITYYPRALEAHAAFGKTVAQIQGKYDLSSISFGDAGMVAFHSNLEFLDNIGLGSGMVAHQGLSREVISAYNPKIIGFYGRPESIEDTYNQPQMLEWAKSRKMTRLCGVYFRPDYTLLLFSYVHIDEIVALCEKSGEINNRDDRTYIKDTLKFPPWIFWKE
jgi:hypothetical protein